MRILVVGSGGREHALVWAIAGSPLATDIYCAPGNAGIAEDAICVDIAATDVPALVRFAVKERIDLVVIGPEAALEAGLADALAAESVLAFGPSKAAAAIETSKGYMKDLCARVGVPTADYRRFTDADKAAAYVRERGAPIVVKADGLAAGKGVVVAETVEEALAAVDACMRDAAFGAAGAEVVIEEFMAGEEVSFFALVDGEDALPFASAQDHKRAFDGDQGPNTGGMGAYSPAPCLTPKIAQDVLDQIIQPTMDEMARRGTPYQGVLFAGLMIEDGKARLVEYNCRFGDPEAQVLMMRLGAQVLDLIQACAEGRLDSVSANWADDHAVSVVMAAQGYPGDYVKGSEIRGLDTLPESSSAIVFHAGTAEVQGQITATGGRVLGVTARGASLAEAQGKAYEMIDQIDWSEGFCRRDIGWRAL